MWNRSKAALSALPADVVLENLEDVEARRPDLIVEVAHPSITEKVGGSIESGGLTTCRAGFRVI